VRLLADENIPGLVVTALRREDHDVVWITETDSGTSDLDVLQRAVEERRVLLTLDTDFGTLIFHRDRPALTAVLLFRVDGMAPSELADLVLSTPSQRSDWVGCMAVIDPDQIRIRSLPQ
jgi:predicted nuclease of predicted toxin-antitoxin system